MPAIIDSAPDCIQNINGAQPPDDSADFILQKAYENCAGFFTFGPGSTYGEDGSGANGVYYAVVVLGMLVTLFVLLYWMYWENHRLHARRLILRGGTGAVEAE
jgi:hypothetical protein